MHSTLTGKTEPATILSSAYAFTSKHNFHRRLVYNDLSRTKGNILALTGPEMLDAPAALEAGIPLERLYLTSKELTLKHLCRTKAHVLLEKELLDAAERCYNNCITFSGANLDMMDSLTPSMLSYFKALGEIPIWDKNAVISVNICNFHHSSELAKRKKQLLENRSFIDSFIESYNIAMPEYYISNILPSLIGPMAASQSFCQGAGLYPKPFGLAHGVYNGKDDTTNSKMGWITFQLRSSPVHPKLSSYIKELLL